MDRRRFFRWLAGVLVAVFLPWRKAKAKPKPEPKPFTPYDLGEGEYALVFTHKDPAVYATGNLVCSSGWGKYRPFPEVLIDPVTKKRSSPKGWYVASINSAGLDFPYIHPEFPDTAYAATGQSALLVRRDSQDSWGLTEVTVTGLSIRMAMGEPTSWGISFCYKEVIPGDAAAFFDKSLGIPYKADGR